MPLSVTFTRMEGSIRVSVLGVRLHRLLSSVMALLSRSLRVNDSTL